MPTKTAVKPSAIETSEAMLRRIGDLLGFVDFAFPGASKVSFDDRDPTTFYIVVTNVLQVSVEELIIPKLWSRWEREHVVYDGEQRYLLLQFRFPPEMWPQMLPVFFLPSAHGKPENITPTHLGALLLAIAEGSVDGKEYQEWIAKNMFDT